MQQRVQPVRVDRQQRPALVQQPLGDRVHRKPHRRLRGPLRAAGLEQEQPLLLDRELDVLHVAVVALERPQRLDQLGVRLGHHPGHVVQPLGVADARDHVLALGVGEEVTRGLRLAGDLVAAEGDPEPESSPLLPKTICCTLTAVPQLSGIPLRRRYSTARRPFHESNTARIESVSCSRGSSGNSSPVTSR